MGKDFCKVNKGFIMYDVLGVMEEKIVYPWHKKNNKYNAKKTVIDNVTFASKKEAKRYEELKFLEKAGVISDLVLQPSYTLHAINNIGEKIKIGKCILDFLYFAHFDSEITIEDVKGLDNPLSKWKRKHVEAEYGIKVTII